MILRESCAQLAPRDPHLAHFLTERTPRRSINRFFLGFRGGKFFRPKSHPRTTFFGATSRDHSRARPTGGLGPGLQPPWCAGLEPLDLRRAWGLSPEGMRGEGPLRMLTARLDTLHNVAISGSGGRNSLSLKPPCPLVAPRGRGKKCLKSENPYPGTKI